MKINFKSIIIILSIIIVLIGFENQSSGSLDYEIASFTFNENEYSDIIRINKRNLSGLSVSGTGDQNNPYIIENLKFTGLGIEVFGIDDYVLIKNNIFDGLNSYTSGISIINSPKAIVEDNLIQNYQKSGIRVEFSNDVQIRENEIIDCLKGVQINNSLSPDVSLNIISSNNIGISLESSNNAQIYFNIIEKNDIYGVEILSGDSNSINKNTFDDNNNGGRNQALDNSENGNNLFENNFWNRFGGVDENSDGIFESPYLIDGNANNRDNGPLVERPIDFGVLPNTISDTGIPLESQILVVIILLVTIIPLLYFFYVKKLKKSKTIFSIIETGKLQYLRTLHQKIILGIEKHKTSLLPQEEAIPVSPISIDTTNLVSISNIFPPDYKDDLISDIKGRTVLILVELAFQYPEKSFPSHISKTLNVPKQTMSDELKKLEKLGYIEEFINTDTLTDVRAKFYKLTQRGIFFLYLLKDVVAYTIVNMKH
ncbi:MAG: right-handed parallel beta-helix repeat-containing protein [Candidatus Hodarchaeales archaeon]